MKKTLSILIMICMVFGMVPISVFATENLDTGLSYVEDDEKEEFPVTPKCLCNPMVENEREHTAENCPLKDNAPSIELKCTCDPIVEVGGEHTSEDCSLKNDTPPIELKCTCDPIVEVGGEHTSENCPLKNDTPPIELKCTCDPIVEAGGVHTDEKCPLFGTLSLLAVNQDKLWTDDGNYNPNWPGLVDYDNITDFEIYNERDFAAFAKAVNDGTNNAPRTFEGKTVTLKSDLTLGAYNWVPIGAPYDQVYKGRYFGGTFDGGGHIIGNLQIKDIYNVYSNGLFGHIYGGTVENLTLAQAVVHMPKFYIDGVQYDVGILAGTASNATIRNIEITSCTLNYYMEGSYWIMMQVGGLVGSVNTYGENLGETTITDIKAYDLGITYSVDSNYGERIPIGGMVGSQGKLDGGIGSTADGTGSLLIENVTINNLHMMSSVANFPGATPRTGDISSIGVEYVGGIIGHGGSKTKIVNCSVEEYVVELTDDVTFFGGIAGSIFSYEEGAGYGISKSSAEGKLDCTAIDATHFVLAGGIVGTTNHSTNPPPGDMISAGSMISNCYAEVDFDYGRGNISFGTIEGAMGVATSYTNNPFDFQTIVKNNFAYASSNIEDVAVLWETQKPNDIAATVEENYKYTIKTMPVGIPGNPLTFIGIDGKNRDNPMNFTTAAQSFSELWEVEYSLDTYNPDIYINGSHITFNKAGRYPINVRVYRDGKYNDDFVKWDTFVTAKYAIAVNIGENGTVDLNGNVISTGDYLVEEGKPAKFAFTPDAGYVIDKVSIDGFKNEEAILAREYTFNDVQGNHIVEVTFKEAVKMHTMSVMAGMNGTVSLNDNPILTGFYPVEEGKPAKFVFTPDIGYTIDKVFINGIDQPEAILAGEYTFNDVQGNHIVEVTFKVKMHTMSVMAGMNGTVSLNGNPISIGNYEVEEGKPAKFVFTPDIGYTIDKVFINGIDQPEAILAGEYTFNDVQGDHTVEVIFKAVDKTHTISTTAGINGTVSLNGNFISTGDYPVEEGKPAKFVFTPAIGYTIDKVLIDGIDNQAAILAGEYTFDDVQGNHTVEVTFKKLDKTYNISAITGTNGTVSLNGNPISTGDYPVEEGKPAKFVFTPSIGYKIEKVLIDGKDNPDAILAGEYTFDDVQGNHTVEVAFKELDKTHTISATTGTNGTVSLNGNPISTGNYRVEEGKTAKFVFTPDAGYKIYQVLVDGVNVPKAIIEGSYTFADVKEKHTIEVTFIKSNDGNGGGTNSGRVPTKVEEKPKLDIKDHIAYVRGYADGRFEPDNAMTRAEVAVILSNLAAVKPENIIYKHEFSDTSSSDWYSDKLAHVVGLGIMEGYPDGSFRPDDKVTRAEFATIISNFSELKLNQEVSFKDVSNDHWANDYISNVVSQKWMGGYIDGSFRPENGITRAEVVVVINSMLGRQADKIVIDKEHKGFTDLNDSHWAYYQIMEAAMSHKYTIDENNKEMWETIK